MPMYEYWCHECDVTFEEFFKFPIMVKYIAGELVTTTWFRVGHCLFLRYFLNLVVPFQNSHSTV